MYSSTRFIIMLLASACVSSVGAMDIEFKKLQCDQSLPAYAMADDIQMTCNDGQNTKCSFGQEVNIRGTCEL